MKSIFVVALGLALAFQLVLARVSSRKEWEQYKRLHGKVYKSPEEDARRFGLFLAAKDKIKRHNAIEGVSHKLALNHMSDWTTDEFARINGFRYNATEHTRRLAAAAFDPFLQAILDADSPVMDELDWCKVPGRVGPVKNQGQCGSCWAFATTGLLEGQEVTRNLTKRLVQLSEQNLLDCSPQDFGCGGGFMSYALEDIADEGGIESEKDYPYLGAEGGKCRFSKKKAVMADKGAIDLPKGDEKTLQVVLARYGPIAVAIEATEHLRHYKSGILFDPICTDRLNHAVLLVGYGTDPEHGDYWILVSTGSIAGHNLIDSG
jgi:hypothetical protein